MTNAIIDIYHGNSIDFEKVKNAGIVAVIHKATQGASITDSKYLERKVLAKQAGLLWGAYHFATGSTVADQVENFLSFAKPEEDELISLDWEPNTNGASMTLAQAREFVQMIKNETGRYPLVYGGHLLRELIGQNPDSILSNCPLWYARYSNSPIGIPAQVWATYTLWQYTDGNVGPEPHETPGVGGADRNIYQGSVQELKEAWPFTKKEEGTVVGVGFESIVNENIKRTKKPNKKK